tara:strand:+ start:297 stop:557 length:261 start_codon:yes stop_codon:yes gene_type:complete
MNIDINYVVSRFDMYMKEWVPMEEFDDIIEAVTYWELAYSVGNSKVTKHRALRIVDTATGTVLKSIVPNNACMRYICDTAGEDTLW